MVIAERESKTLEFKSRLPHFSALIKTCVAFANGLGGKIMVGVNDKSREVIGVDEATRNRLYDEFPNSLYDATSPSLLAEIYEKRMGEKSVLIIEIYASHKKPVFVKAEGSMEGVYLRAGSNTRRANREYIEELHRENRRIFFDEEVVHAEQVPLSPLLLEKAFGKYDEARLIAEKVLTRLTPSGQKVLPTVSGLLMFGDAPEVALPEAVIYCTRFKGIEGRDIIQTEEVSGHLVKQAELSYELVKSWLLREYYLHGATLKAKTLIPDIALREVIINALMHRKYWITGAIKIALYEDRLEVFSPGGFPGLLDVNHLGDGTTYLRNPTLARLARRLGLIEKLGTGIRVMIESCDKAGLRRPEFIEGADSVKVVFRFLPGLSVKKLDQGELLALFEMKDKVSLKDVESMLNVSRNTATRRLNQLIEAGKIKREGKGPAVRYTRLS